MGNNSSGCVDNNPILAAIRRAVDANGGKWVPLRDFLETAGVTHGQIFSRYPRWEDAVRAAGFKFPIPNARIALELLLADWGTVTRALQKSPSKAEYRVHGKYSPETLSNRLGCQTAVQAAFLKFAGDKPEWKDVCVLIPWVSEGAELSRRKGPWPGAKRHAWKSRRRSCSAPTYGPLLGFGALRHAPVNESGVILLFGMLAERLGFIVDAMQSYFPDCEAIRKTGVDTWERVRIEFEYESRNFKTHKHDTAGCDLIVCWAHNWPECPVEVMALRDEIARLA